MVVRRDEQKKNEIKDIFKSLDDRNRGIIKADKLLNNMKKIKELIENE